MTGIILASYNEQHSDNKKIRNGVKIMKNQIVVKMARSFLCCLFLFCSSTVFSQELTGGISFTGDREGVCVLIEGEYIAESIYFKLDTCDDNQEVKEQFKDRAPFTLLVPEGEHRLVIMKEGEKVVTDTIKIKSGEILDYKLP